MTDHQHEIVSKQDFAKLAGVRPSCVSNWIARRQLSGDAIIGTGNRSRINVAVARAQLKQNLDPSQIGGNRKARLEGTPKDGPTAGASGQQGRAPGAAGGAGEAQREAEAPDTIEDRIKGERLEQLALSNAKARAEAAARSGHYVKSEDARREMGRITSRLMTIFEASLMEFGNAIVAHAPASPRDALRVLRATWREIRIRQAKSNSAEAAALPPLLEDQGDDTDD